ncbi:MAG: hypothetical protein M3N43_14680 [Actinomycetota bacterium]|nr:hypothetical protein [Actinomycetota bacterium]
MARPRASGEPKLFSARKGFAAIIDGHTIILKPGDVVDAADPILKGRKDLFEDFVPKVRQYNGQRVEQATAAPGEKRGT